ncbi:MAG: alpha/beta fold hydrolase [Desulfobacterales bacterium]|nr:MAG: alpha/beta fold hydrolase [Desulfobacterales bacterium]
MKKSGNTDNVPMVMPWLFSKPFRKQQPENVKEIKERLTKNYLTRNSAAFERQLNANITHDTRNQLGEIKSPTLILVGKDDELTSPNMAEELRSEIPDSKLLICKQGGHALYWEVPDLFNKAVLDFINS